MSTTRKHLIIIIIVLALALLIGAVIPTLANTTAHWITSTPEKVYAVWTDVPDWATSFTCTLTWYYKNIYTEDVTYFDYQKITPCKPYEYWENGVKNWSYTFDVKYPEHMPRPEEQLFVEGYVCERDFCVGIETGTEHPYFPISTVWANAYWSFSTPEKVYATWWHVPEWGASEECTLTWYYKDAPEDPYYMHFKYQLISPCPYEEYWLDPWNKVWLYEFPVQYPASYPHDGQLIYIWGKICPASFCLNIITFQDTDPYYLVNDFWSIFMPLVNTNVSIPYP